MNNFKLTLVLVIAALVIFLVLAVTGINSLARPVNVTVVRGEEARVEPQPEEVNVEPEEAKPPEIPPPSPEPILPCDGLIEPGCLAYGLQGDAIVSLGKLKSQYFHCKVHKKVEAAKGRYYLVEITHDGFKGDFYLIEQKHVTLLACAGDLALLP